jgi:signal peptidase I
MKAAGTTLIFLLLLVAGCGGGKGETEAYEVPSESMEPTFSVGEELTVELEAYEDDEPEAGDVVVFNPPSGADDLSGCGVKPNRGQACPQPTAGLSDQSYLKRIVAVPGDELSFQGGLPIVNGEKTLDEVIQTCRGGLCDLPEPIVIPPDHYFMLGDNSGASDDSRIWGPIPLAAILGRVDE